MDRVTIATFALMVAWLLATLSMSWSPAVVLNEPAPEVHVVLTDGGCACYLEPR